MTNRHRITFTLYVDATALADPSDPRYQPIYAAADAAFDALDDREAERFVAIAERALDADLTEVESAFQGEIEHRVQVAVDLAAAAADIPGRPPTWRQSFLLMDAI